jgi:hypothetical protein
MDQERIRDKAEQLVRMMSESEAEVASAVEDELFPDGLPPSLSIAILMRAQAAVLSRSAEDLARADVAYQEALEQELGERAPVRASRVSQDVAQKVARAAEFERAIDAYADELGASMEERFFPDGLPQPFTVRTLLAAIRERLERGLARSAPGAAGAGPTAGTEAGTDAGTDDLEHELQIVASLYSGFAGLARQTDLAAEIAEIAELPEPPV